MIRKSLAFLPVLAVGLALAGPAGAAEFTEVIDAFDEGDPFDVSLIIGYSRTLSMGNITRECAWSRDPVPPEFTAYREGCPQIEDGDFPTTVDVLRYVHVRQVLNIEVLIGIWHDLNLRLALPIIVSDARELKLAKGVDQGAAASILNDDTMGDIDGDTVIDRAPLFNVPFKSPDRSGIDQFGVGLQWAIMNQERDEAKPTWTLWAEGWFAVGKIWKAKGSYDGPTGKVDLGADKGGISPGYHSLRVGTRISRRFKYMDPYFGFEAHIPFPKKGESPWPYMDKYSGQINDMPPIEGSVRFGTEIVPWENKGKQQKFYIDLRIIGTYHSEGRAITPLFDALGTSDAVGIDFSGNSSFMGPDGAYPNYRWTGLTDIENYMTFGGKLSLGFITGKWFKIHTGVMFAHDTEHYLTFTDECNPNNFDSWPSGLAPVGQDGGSNCEWQAGSQADEDSYNPDFRRAIDALGNRFRMEESTIFEFFIQATAMF